MAQNTHLVQGEGLEPHPQNPAAENTSIRGAVEAAMKDAQDKANEPDPDELPEAADGADDTADALGGATDQAPASDSPDSQVAEGEPEVGDLEPPADWSAADQDVFRGVDKDTQNWLLERDKATREALQNQLSALQPYQQVEQTWSPYLQNRGKPAAVLLNDLMNADYLLRQGTPEQKKAMLDQIVRDYGIQMDGPQQPQVPEDVANDPVYGALGGELRRLHEGLSTLQTQMQSQFGAMQQNQVNAQQQALQSFKTETDDKGQLKHPYYGEVEGLMNSLAQDALANGRQTTLEDVYQQACWAHPEVRAKLQSAENAAAIRARKASAAKKQAASKSVSSSPQGTRTVEALPKGKKGETVRETVERAAAQAGFSHA